MDSKKVGVYKEMNILGTSSPFQEMPIIYVQLVDNVWIAQPTGDIKWLRNYSGDLQEFRWRLLI